MCPICAFIILRTGPVSAGTGKLYLVMPPTLVNSLVGSYRKTNLERMHIDPANMLFRGR